MWEGYMDGSNCMSLVLEGGCCAGNSGVKMGVRLDMTLGLYFEGLSGNVFRL